MPALASICVLDDDPSVVAALRRLLEAEGWTVAVFTDPETYLRQAAPGQGQLLLLDFAMPGMNGLEVVRAIRAKGLAIRVVLLTAEADPWLQQMATQAGISAYYLKPFVPAELIGGLRQLLAEPAVERPE